VDFGNCEVTQLDLVSQVWQASSGNTTW
jgi:hypothetical protein